MASSPHVFLAATSLKPSYGGPAFSVSALAAALARSGARVTLWAADGSATASPLVAAGDGLTLSGGGVPEALTAAGSVDVIHDNGLWLPHNHRLAGLARSRGITRVVSLRGMLEPWAMAHKGLKKRLAFALYQRRDLSRAAVLHATSDEEAANAARLGLGRPIRVVPNGVDLPVTLPPRAGSPDGRRTALFLGRIYPVKGLPLLVEAWSRVRPEGWRLVIAGPDEASHRAEVEALVARLGLGREIAFPGAIAPEDRTALYGSADVFILPSHSENFGMAVAEALAHGVPVLTTRGTPWPMLAERGCGWQVETSVPGLEGGLRAALAKPAQELAGMGAAGRAFMQAAFGWDAVARRMHDLYVAARAGKSGQTDV
jgi:glycosyltransferase involved in cell wall biosynthesis